MSDGTCAVCPPGVAKSDFSGPGQGCTRCLFERIAPNPGTGDCETCPAGLVSNAEHTKCVTCPPGLVARPPDEPLGWETMQSCVSPRTNCPLGAKRRLNHGRLNFCQVRNCAVGSWPSYAGCRKCEPGFYYKEGKDPRWSQCRRCRVREVSEGGAQRVCDACENGFVRDAKNGSRCVCAGVNASGRGLRWGKCRLCELGTFNDGTTTPAECSHCPIGYIASGRGAKKCTKCPDGKTTAEIGSMRCVDV